MENQRELDILSVIATHLESIGRKLYEKDIVLSPIERMLLWELTMEKLNSIGVEAYKLLPKPPKGRPKGRSYESRWKEFQIAKEYYDRFEPSQSESLYTELMEKHGYKDRSSIIKAIKRGKEFPMSISTSGYDKKRIERSNEVDALVKSGISVTEACQELARRDRQQHKDKMEMMDMFIEGMRALEEIKY